jgi:hypothetical protein
MSSSKASAPQWSFAYTNFIAGSLSDALLLHFHHRNSLFTRVLLAEHFLTCYKFSITSSACTLPFALIKIAPAVSSYQHA